MIIFVNFYKPDILLIHISNGNPARSSYCAFDTKLIQQAVCAKVFDFDDERRKQLNLHFFH